MIQGSVKRWLPLAAILLAAVAAIVVAHRQQVDTRPSADAVLSAAADAQHEATRLPARIDVLSDEDEQRIGDQLAAEYDSETPLDPKHATPKQIAAQQQAMAQRQQVEAYLNQVGNRVVENTRRHLRWKFHYLPQKDFVNAFALPGGHLFIGDGLLRLMDSEDALAAVLGHESQHVDLRHCAERVQAEAHLRNLDMLGLPMQIFIAGYSKDQESQADRDGTALAVKAGYSPQGILHLMQAFKKLEGQPDAKPDTPVEEAAGLTLGSLSGYFQSHPPAGERYKQIESLIRTNRWPSPPLVPLRSLPPVPKPEPKYAESTDTKP